MNDSISVLHVIAGAAHGGAETFFLDMVQALDDAGVKQRVICRDHENYVKALKSRNIEYDALKFNLFDRCFRSSRLIRSVVSKTRPTVIHAWMGRGASFIPASLPTPVIGWFGGYYDLKRYRTSDFYIGVTRDIVRHIGEKSGKPENAFLVHTFGTLPKSPPVTRAAFDTPEDAPLVLLLSRMHEKKGVDTLLKAARDVPGAYFWLAGDGPRLADYEALARKDETVARRVRFLGWRNDREALFNQADVCVLPSRYEPFGTVMAEAWAMETPLVAARAAGPSQYVKHGENGLLCEIDDAADLAEQLRQAIENQPLRQKIVQGGKETYQELFNKDAVVNAMLDVYRRAQNSNRR